MALVPYGKDCFIDTDDLDQEEYHYYTKAEKFADNARKRYKRTDSVEDLRQVNKCHHVAMMLLTGRISAQHAVERYEWLRGDPYKEEKNARSERNTEVGAEYRICRDR